MIKKINSTVKLDVKKFKISVGTTDRINANTFYLDIKTIINPIEKKNSYNDDVSMLKKGVHSVALSAINKINSLKNNLFIENNYIVDMDVAKDRMAPKKKSYLTCQLYFKQKGSVDFNSIVEIMKENIGFITDDFTSNIEANSFEIHTKTYL